MLINCFIRWFIYLFLQSSWSPISVRSIIHLFLPVYLFSCLFIYWFVYFSAAPLWKTSIQKELGLWTNFSCDEPSLAVHEAIDTAYKNKHLFEIFKLSASILTFAYRAGVPLGMWPCLVRSCPQVAQPAATRLLADSGKLRDESPFPVCSFSGGNISFKRSTKFFSCRILFRFQFKPK